MVDQVIIGFPQVLLWLLGFAVMFGLLSQANMPKSKASRGIIAIGIATLIMIYGSSSMIQFLSQTTSSLVLVVIMLLVLIAFVETAGVGKTSVKTIVTDEKGKTHEVDMPTTIFKKYSTVFGAALIIVAILIFLGAGGWQLLGLGNVTFKDLGSESMLGIVFLAAVVIGVIWMIAESKESV